MKYLLLNIPFLILISCASNDPANIGMLNIEVQPATVVESTLQVVEAKIIEPVLGENNYELKEAPFTPSYARCGWVPLNDQEEVRRMLEDADVVIKLTGVYEEWVPINGKPKKYYVLKVE